MTLVIADEDVERLGDMAAAMAAVRPAFTARAQGTYVAPPRHHVSFPGAGDLVFSAGGTMEGRKVAGFRAFDLFQGGGQQLTAVWDTDAAELLGIVLGPRLGQRRTGAIGGIAVDEMAAPDAKVLAVVGTGRQARAQLMAAAAVRAFEEVRVFSRTSVRAEAFVSELQSAIEAPIRVLDDARQAVQEADVVITATSSATPVLEAGWLSPGVHINMIGPKTANELEIGLDVVELAQTIAIDAPDQAKVSFFLRGTPHMDRLVDLADIVTGRVAARPTGMETTLFTSAGLTGTEVLLAAALLDEARRRRW